MVGLDDVVEGVIGGTSWGLGLGIAAGALLLAARGGRPLMKGAVKGYLTLSEKVKEATAEVAEELQDVYAEAKAEYEAQPVVEASPASARPRPRRPRPAPVEEGA
ncbi:MAG: DUF5132 domain-containing protein [Chloroflexi bacterium]|nr:DUF5132 domain-containing protein [Chloroflexota bacterium]MDA8187628.1 DUF5132 domain-containing protein [Dehalococcoidales bacterium]